MSKDTTHIRVKVATRARLLALIASLVGRCERGVMPELRDNLENPNPAALAMSFDAAINHLLDLPEQHRARAAASAAKKKATKTPAAKKPAKPGSKKQ